VSDSDILQAAITGIQLQSPMHGVIVG